MPITASVPQMPDPRLPMTDASGVLRPEWAAFFAALTAWLKLVKDTV